MPIVNVQSNISFKTKNPSEDTTITSNQFNKDFEYTTMSQAAFDAIMAEMYSGLKLVENLDPVVETPNNGESGSILEDTSTADKVVSITNFAVQFSPIAEGIRRIKILSNKNQQDLNFISELNSPKIYTQPNKYDHIYFVEKGFSDIQTLQTIYTEFLIQLSKCIDTNDINLNSFKDYFSVSDIKLKGTLTSKFTFVFNNIKWEVQNLTQTSIKTAHYNIVQ